MKANANLSVWYLVCRSCRTVANELEVLVHWNACCAQDSTNKFKVTGAYVLLESAPFSSI